MRLRTGDQTAAKWKSIFCLLSNQSFAKLINYKVGRFRMNPDRRGVPLWLVGLSNTTFGLYNGFIAFTLPQLLSAHHLPEARITAITAAVLSPSFWTFLLAPILDVRFSRRWYATVFAAAAALLLCFSVLNAENVVGLEAALLAGSAAACLSNAALGGWLASIVAKKDESRLSSWFNVANIGGAGLMAVLSMEFLRRLPPHISAPLLGTLIFLPTSVFLFIPAPGPDRRLAQESFLGLFREILVLIKRREVLVAILLFVSPSASFTLTNILTGLSRDFRASERVVSRVGGVGVILAGICGSLLFPHLSSRLPSRVVYLLIGIAGAFFSLSVIVLPHTPVIFSLAMLGENIFQALAFTSLTAISFETIGADNPLAATQFGLLMATAALPLVYMQIVDGYAYTLHGLAGILAADGGISIAACTVLASTLLILARSPAKTRMNGLKTFD
jgi:MFS transporter, PAT family, beta-lactamase induction signal transducer AmpG